MKRRTILHGVIGGVLLSSLAGCGGDSGGAGGANGTTTASVVGTWKATAVRAASGQQASCPASFTLAPNVFLECSADDRTTFNSDGTISDSGGATFTVGGNRMTVNVPASGSDAAYSSTFIVSLIGSQLTATQVSSTSPDPTLGSDYNGTSTFYQKQ